MIERSHHFKTSVWVSMLVFGRCNEVKQKQKNPTKNLTEYERIRALGGEPKNSLVKWVKCLWATFSSKSFCPKIWILLLSNPNTIENKKQLPEHLSHRNSWSLGLPNLEDFFQREMFLSLNCWVVVLRFKTSNVHVCTCIHICRLCHNKSQVKFAISPEFGEVNIKTYVKHVKALGNYGMSPRHNLLFFQVWSDLTKSWRGHSRDFWPPMGFTNKHDTTQHTLEIENNLSTQN